MSVVVVENKTIVGNRVPLYRQVANALKQGIRSGRFLSGETLPTVRKLSKEYNVSVKVVQEAIRYLREEGAVITHHGRGMVVMDSDPCKKTSFLFGLISPYSSGMAFEQQVILYAEEAFDNRDNLMVVRTSKGNFQTEKIVAEHLVNNGVQGILLWPVENSPNEEYFRILSNNVPVILVDREINTVGLPSVTLDMFSAGEDVCEYFFNICNKKRLLLLMANSQISPYVNFVQGVQSKALRIGKLSDVTIIQLPIFEFISELNQGKYSSVDTYVKTVAQLLNDGSYDVVFCPQEEFIESVIIETGLVDKFVNLALGSMTGPILTRGRKYNEFGVVRWVWDFPSMISRAADVLQDWVMSRKRSQDSIKIRIPMWDDYFGKNGSSRLV